MKHHKSRLSERLKATGIAAGAVIVGVALLWLSAYIEATAPPPPEASAGPATAPPAALPTATTPASGSAATAPATAPAESPPVNPTDSPEQRRASAMNMSGMIFMFSLLCFGVAVICLGWLGWDIYRARPAWKTQTKYPRRR